MKKTTLQTPHFWTDDDKGVWNTDLVMNGIKVTFKIDIGTKKSLQSQKKHVKP